MDQYIYWCDRGFLLHLINALIYIYIHNNSSDVEKTINETNMYLHAYAFSMYAIIFFTVDRRV